MDIIASSGFTTVNATITNKNREPSATSVPSEFSNPLKALT